MSLGKKIFLFDLTVLKNDTDNIIDYVKKDSLKNNKKYYFWNLLKNND